MSNWNLFPTSEGVPASTAPPQSAAVGSQQQPLLSTLAARAHPSLQVHAQGSQIAPVAMQIQQQLMMNSNLSSPSPAVTMPPPQTHTFASFNSLLQGSMATNPPLSSLAGWHIPQQDGNATQPWVAVQNPLLPLFQMPLLGVTPQTGNFLAPQFLHNLAAGASPAAQGTGAQGTAAPGQPVFVRPMQPTPGVATGNFAGGWGGGSEGVSLQQSVRPEPVQASGGRAPHDAAAESQAGAMPPPSPVGLGKLSRRTADTLSGFQPWKPSAVKEQSSSGGEAGAGASDATDTAGEGEGEGRAEKQARKCEHNRQRNKCKECRGTGICEHNRLRRMCKQCRGSGICEHNRQWSICRECKGSQICEHNRRRSRCKECGGVQICLHRRRRSRCKECGGSAICEHMRERRLCKDCKGSGICEHLRQRRFCKQCKLAKAEKERADAQSRPADGSAPGAATAASAQPREASAAAAAQAAAAAGSSRAGEGAEDGRAGRVAELASLLAAHGSSLQQAWLPDDDDDDE